jgi:UDPglucose 6-dehydrogenase
MDIAVIGLGYVGLVTSGCLAHLGHHVTGVEISDERLSSLSRGTVPFHEPGLDEMVGEGLRAGRLRFTGSAQDAVANADIVIVAVGTHDGHGGWQTFTLLSAVREVAPAMPDASVLVIRSTMPPAFGDRVAATARQARAEAGRPSIPVLVNPEFTKEGSAVRDYLSPDRVVIGVIDDPDRSGIALLERLYEPFGAPILVMSGVDATIAKLAANLFLATKISFANELASLCDAFGADVSKVVGSMGHDTRIGPAFLRAGVGFGGSCLPHQVSMTARTAGDVGLELPLIQAVEGVNERQRDRFVARLDLLAGGLEGRRVALLGLAFKPETDDLRDAPSLEIARQLLAAGATVVAYDPMERAREGAHRAVPGLRTVASAAEALDGADVAGLVTEWSEFIGLDWAAIGSTMAHRAIVDGRNALDPATMEAAGFQMLSFGRRPVGPVQDVAIPVAPLAAEELTAVASAGA